MNERMNSSIAKTVLAHTLTVFLTISLMAIILHHRASPRHLAVQIPGPAQQLEPISTPDDVALTSATTINSETQAPPPPKDVLSELDSDERNNVNVYAA